MIIYLRVKPNSFMDKIEKLDDGAYLIYTKARAVDGKANLSAIKMLAKEFGVSFRDIIIKSPKSRKKIIQILTL